MSRTIALKLNKFEIHKLPHSLLASNGVPVKTLVVELKKLFHHYFLAKYGGQVCDDGNYEYQRCLTSGPDWRFRNSGIGADKETKINASNELGKAFARWFHYEHLGFTYFCPLEKLLNRNFDGLVWRRSGKGNLPDYVCGPDERGVNLLEAKGRYPSVTFEIDAFNKFRDQLKTVELRQDDIPVAIKGFISVARWATEKNPNVQSTLLVEDPWTEGQPPGRGWTPGPIGLAMVLGHYASIFEHLRLHTYADAIREGRGLPRHQVSRAGLWECIRGPLAKRRFIGGLLNATPLWPFLPIHSDFLHFWELWDQTSPFILAPPLQFAGLEEKVMEEVLAVGRLGPRTDRSIAPVEVPEETGTLSLLRDGSVLGPAHYFAPIRVVEL